MTTVDIWSPGRVMDQSGLGGKYDFKLLYAGNGQIGAMLRPDLASAATTSADGMGPSEPGSGPSLMQAIEKELGLKLAHRKMTIDMFIIDRVDQAPEEN